MTIRAATRHRALALMSGLAMALLSAACSSNDYTSSVPSTTPGSSAAPAAVAGAPNDVDADAPVDADADAARDEPWRTLPLEDVRTGETFSIAELAGKLVAIEPMAIWCSNCRIQQHEAVAALAEVDSEDLVYIGVDVDPNERARALARYAKDEGFDWPFVVASRDLARSMAESFGDQVLSPPSTPLILVGPEGDVLDVHFGIRRAGELAAALTEHLPTG